MNFILLLNQYSTVLLVLFALGCMLACLNERNRRQGGTESKLRKLFEWVLLIPGYAYIFIFLQEKCVLLLVANTGIGVAVLLGGVLASVVLIFLKKKRPGLIVTFLAGLVGTPVLVFTLIVLGQFVFLQDRFAELKRTHSKLESTVGLEAPNFDFVIIGSCETVQLHNYRGKLLLINVWATWCGPCLVEMPALDRLQQKYLSEGLLVLNLSDESDEVIRNFLEKNPMSTVHGRVSNRQSVPDFYQFGKARPTTFVIDREGTVVETLAGGKSYRVFEEIVTRLL